MPVVVALSKVERVFGDGARRVLGIDPGLTRCGVGVVEGGPGNRLQLVAVAVLETPREAEIGARLAHLQRELAGWLDRYRPAEVAVEEVFSQHNVRTVMGTAQVGGVALAAAGQAGLRVGVHTPTEVKAAVTGSGRADKSQVAAMVGRLLRLAGPPAPADAADALALAICHLWRSSPLRAGVPA